MELKLMEKHQKNYVTCEDEIKERICTKCGQDHELDEEIVDCEKEDCDGEVVTVTELEDTHCHKCNRHFDMWEEGVMRNVRTNIQICEDCYDDLPVKRDE